MRTTKSLRLGISAAILLVVAGVDSALAQGIDPLVKGKALYAEASYDDALRVLGTNQGPEAHQYRALCFLALGKTHEAEGALEALIAVSPEYALSDADSPPRLVSLFTQTKRRLMPSIVRKMFSEARDDYQAKELERARGKFERVLALSHDPAITDAPDLKDLQLLVTGYLEIVKNAQPPAFVAATTVARGAAPVPAAIASPNFPSAVPTAVAASAPTAVGASAPTAVVASAPTTAQAPAPRSPAPTPSPAFAAASVPATAQVKTRGPVVVPAVTLRQTVPSYAPLAGAPVKALSGTIKVVIGPDGKVKSATMAQSVEPRYDIRLVAAAKSWLFKPATLDGQPIESEKLVSVTVGTP